MHLSAQEFMERYEATEPSFKAELINGVVYVASPGKRRPWGSPGENGLVADVI